MFKMPPSCWTGVSRARHERAVAPFLRRIPAWGIIPMPVRKSPVCRASPFADDGTQLFKVFEGATWLVTAQGGAFYFRPQFRPSSCRTSHRAANLGAMDQPSCRPVP